MLCSACQTELPSGSAFCPKCGAKVAAAPHAAERPADKMRSAQAAAAASTEREQQLWHGGFSPKAMYGSWILAVLATSTAIVASILIPTPITWIVAVAAVGAIWLISLAYYLIAR